MSETKPDYTTMARERMGDLEAKRGLVAAELSACEGDLRKMRGEFPGGEHAAAHKRGSLALEAVLGDEDAPDDEGPPEPDDVADALEVLDIERGAAA